MKHEGNIHSVTNVNVGLIRRSGESKFTCEMCGRDFGKDRSTYEAHLTPRLCKHGKAESVFEVDQNLRFPCDQCEKTFSEKDVLDRHIRWKHTQPIRMFECCECDASFQLKSSLVKHIKKIHKNN